MQTLEELKRRLDSTRDLQSVVKTMKAMAAVRIRQYQRAVESLEAYNRTVEMALQVALRDRPGILISARPASQRPVCAVIFGSDQGMCGQLNDQIVSYGMKDMEETIGVGGKDRLILAVGDRVRANLEYAGQRVDQSIPVPASATGITARVQSVITRIEEWHRENGLEQVYLYYSEHRSGASYRPRRIHLLPVDREWLSTLREKSWPRHVLPQYTMAWDPLFSALIREYLFVTLFRAFGQSLASENASRLASMQGAEKNIEERLEELSTLYHQRRQMSITEELLDIVAGFEVLKGAQ